MLPVDSMNTSDPGHIGEEGFRRILRHPKLPSYAFVLKTPSGDKAMTLADGVQGRADYFRRLLRVTTHFALVFPKKCVRAASFPMFGQCIQAGSFALFTKTAAIKQSNTHSSR